MTSSHVLAVRSSDDRPRPGEIRLFARCRNEQLRLPAFLDHYRRLGVDRFFIVDNDSTDGSTEFLLEQPDVRLFRTANSYREARSGADWLNALLAQFGVGAWCVTVDVDELLVYPGSEHASLPAFTAYLDRAGSEALFCVMLDLYPGGTLNECRYARGENLVAAAPYFDPEPYRRARINLCPGVLVRGGMRERVFYPEFRARGAGRRVYDRVLEGVAHRLPFLREVPMLRARRRRNPPCLTKVPLARWDERTTYLGIHWLSPKRVAAETGVLLHFKFLQDFHERAVLEVPRAEHYDLSSEYRRYAATLNASPGMTFMYEQSVRFENTSQLTRLGLLNDTNAWADARRTLG